MKTIIIACGAGVATSAMMASKIEQFLSDNGIDCQIIQCNVLQLNQYEDGADVIVSSVEVKEKHRCPIVMGLAFISGKGIEETQKELLNVLK